MNQQKKESKLKIINSAELMDLQLPPIKFTVADILPSGLTVFAGAPKVGKSLFILKLCLAVANGENFWCYPTRKGTVLYLALEDSMMRLQKRLCTMADEGSENLYFCNRAPRLDEGLLDELKLFKQAHPDTSLIVIDTFLLVRAPARNNGQNIYERDYVEMNKFQQFAIENDLSVVLIHHGKKAEESDPFKQASGSIGMTAAADSYLLLKRFDRIAREGTLYISGRDIESRDVKIKMNDDAIWELAEELEYEIEGLDPYIRAIVLYLVSKTDIAKKLPGTAHAELECNTLIIQATELVEGANAFLELTGDDALKPNMVKKKLVEYHTQLESLGFEFKSERRGTARTLVFHLIRDRAKVLRFKRGENPIEIPMLVQQVGGTLSDSMTGDSLNNTLSVTEMPCPDLHEPCKDNVAHVSPTELINTLLNERHEAGMYREMEEFFSDGYIVEEDGKKIRKEGTPIEYSILTVSLPGDIDELITGLNNYNARFPLIKKVPMYRKVLLKHLNDLAEYIAGEIRELSDDGNPDDDTMENEAVTCHAVTDVKN